MRHPPGAHPVSRRTSSRRGPGPRDGAMGWGLHHCVDVCGRHACSITNHLAATLQHEMHHGLLCCSARDRRWPAGGGSWPCNSHMVERQRDAPHTSPPPTGGRSTTARQGSLPYSEPEWRGKRDDIALTGLAEARACFMGWPVHGSNRLTREKVGSTVEGHAQR